MSCPTGVHRRGHERGATLVEYGLFLGAFALVALGAVGGLNDAARGYFAGAGSRVGEPSNRITYTDNTWRTDRGATTTVTAAPPTSATTSTAGPSTTAPPTTVAPTTTKVTTTTTTAPTNPAFLTPILSTSASFNWWNGDQTNGNGAWVAGFTFQNNHDRGQTLDLKIVKTNANGTTTTSTASHYVPPNGAATIQVWENNLSVSGGVRTGVVSVTVTVTKVATHNSAWEPISAGANGTVQKVNAP